MTAANPAAPTYCEACGHPSNDGERIRELEAELASEKRLYDQHLKEYWAVVKERDALKARVAELEPEFWPFFREMTRKFRNHISDRGDSWKATGWDIVFRLKQEIAEATAEGALRDEWADVANFAFFAWYRDLKEAPAMTTANPSAHELAKDADGIPRAWCNTHHQEIEICLRALEAAEAELERWKLQSPDALDLEAWEDVCKERDALKAERDRLQASNYRMWDKMRELKARVAELEARVQVLLEQRMKGTPR